jgi:transposase
VPALPSSILEPLWVQFAALLPARQDTHPLGCHRPRIPDRLVFDKLIQILVFGCGYRRIADHTCSATTLRRRQPKRLRRLRDDLRLRHRSTSSWHDGPVLSILPSLAVLGVNRRYEAQDTVEMLPAATDSGRKTGPRRGAANYNQERSYWSLDFRNQRDPRRHLVRTGWQDASLLVRIAPGRRGCPEEVSEGFASDGP